jgi:hypothetical protein
MKVVSLRRPAGSSRWRRDDGSHFDRWIRIHEHVGGEILAAAPRSMTITAPVSAYVEPNIWVLYRLDF